MKQKKIKLLNEHGYQHFINYAQDGIGHTHIAQIHDGKQSHQAYLSTYPNNTHSKSLANEITAYLLASALGLPVAKSAFIVIMPTKLLKNIHPNITFSNAQKHYPLWGISTIPGNSPKYHYNLCAIINNPSFLHDINQWDKLLHTIAFDDWLGNADRNTGNLIRTAKNQYSLIDHEDIASSRHWQAHQIPPEKEIPNKLAQIMWPKYTVPDPKKTSIMINEAEKYTRTNISALHELVYWWKLLLKDDELTALHRFIMKRATICPERIKNRYGTLL